MWVCAMPPPAVVFRTVAAGIFRARFSAFHCPLLPGVPPDSVLRCKMPGIKPLCAISGLAIISRR
jgi:hypothetical protein